MVKKGSVPSADWHQWRAFRYLVAPALYQGTSEAINYIVYIKR